MKSALKRIDTYLFALALVFIGFIPFFVQLVFFLNPSSGIRFEAYPFIMWLMVVIYFLLGIFVPDIYSMKIRKKLNDWDNQLPTENLLIMWRIKTPLWMAALVLFLYCGVVELIVRITQMTGGIGIYPLL